MTSAPRWGSGREPAAHAPAHKVSQTDRTSTVTWESALNRASLAL